MSELTATMGRALSRNEPRRNSSTSSRDDVESLGVDQVGLGQDRDAAAALPSRRQMSKCSRVCGLMDSSAAITSSTRSMPPTPASMLRTKRSWPGTSTKPRRRVSPSGAGKVQVGEAEVDGDAAALLFLEAVGVDAGEGLDQRGLAVVDVAGGADDDGFHRFGIVAGVAPGLKPDTLLGV